MCSIQVGLHSRWSTRIEKKLKLTQTEVNTQNITFTEKRNQPFVLSLRAYLFSSERLHRLLQVAE